MEGMHLQVMSDLHLETPKFLPMYPDFQIEPIASHLALLGDIGNVHDEQLFRFLERVLQKFKLVFYLLGNHEPYANEQDSGPATFQHACTRMLEFEESVTKRRQTETSLGQFVFMNRRRWDIDHQTTVLGCTLFSHITSEQESTVSLFVSDFSNIQGWTVQSHNDAHTTDLCWLNSQVTSISQSELHRQIIILTHHSPTIQAEAHNPDHVEDSRGVQSAFAADLSAQPCWINPVVKVWAFGHTHWNCDYIDNETGKRVIANQRGYGREEIFDFDAMKVIEFPWL